MPDFVISTKGVARVEKSQKKKLYSKEISPCVPFGHLVEMTAGGDSVFGFAVSREMIIECRNLILS